MSSSQIARWSTTLLILFVLFAPSFAQIGMFFDGVTYSGIARQLSLGMGELWSPCYSPYLTPEFFSHLPIWIGWHSIFFLILGDHWWVDGVFQMVNLVLTLIAMYWLWMEVWRSQPPESRPNFHIVIWLWLTVPIVLWTFRNNLLEIGVSFFALLAVGATFRAMRSQSRLSLFSWSAIAALMTLGAFESKGVVGLFPLVSGFVWTIFHQNRRALSLLSSFIPLLLFLLFLGSMFWLIPDTLLNTKQHLNIQLFPALRGELEITTGWRAKILLDCLLDIIPIILLTSFIAWRRPISLTHNQKQIFWSFIAIGLLASLPLCISLKQRKFYLIPSIPYFVMAASTFWFEYKPFSHISKKTYARLKWFWLVSMVSAFIFIGTIYGNISRDYSKWEIAIKASREFAPGTVFLVSPELAHDYTLIACFVRAGSLYISDHPSTPVTHEIRAIQIEHSTRYVIDPIHE
jgi:hypothetical protein